MSDAPARRLTLDEVDYYALLGIEQDAGVDQIRRAFHDFARRYHPDLYALNDPEDQIKAARVYRRGTEAYRVLLNPGRRNEYDRGLARGIVRHTAATAVATRRSSLPPSQAPLSPIAQQHVSEAEFAIRRKDWVEAEKQLRSAKMFAPGHVHVESLWDKVQQALE